MSLIVLHDAISRRREIAREIKELRQAWKEHIAKNPLALSTLRGRTPQKTVAKRAGVPQPKVSLFETGQFEKLSNNTLLRLSRIYAIFEKELVDVPQNDCQPTDRRSA